MRRARARPADDNRLYTSINYCKLKSTIANVPAVGRRTGALSAAYFAARAKRIRSVAFLALPRAPHPSLPRSTRQPTPKPPGDARAATSSIPRPATSSPCQPPSTRGRPGAPGGAPVGPPESRNLHQTLTLPRPDRVTYACSADPRACKRPFRSGQSTGRGPRFRSLTRTRARASTPYSWMRSGGRAAQSSLSGERNSP